MTTKIVNGKEFPLTDAEEKALLDRKTRSEAGASALCLESIRRERNKRLQETDYFALNDVTLTDAMKTYRDNLRKVPQTTSDPVAFQNQWNEFEQGKDGVSDPWPTKP
jgi:hypothetical protein|tara:strand:+ start:1022 stop:1345 length:324 start_codon:yes stop_codon:yes gene_type:complete